MCHFEQLRPANEKLGDCEKSKEMIAEPKVQGFWLFGPVETELPLYSMDDGGWSLSVGKRMLIPSEWLI